MSSKDDEARELARLHYEIESGMTTIYRCTGTDDDANPAAPIKLLEVNQDTIPSGIMPLQFGPNPTAGIHFPSVIIEVTPDEFERIQSDSLSLPPGWTIQMPIPRPTEGVE